MKNTLFLLVALMLIAFAAQSQIIYTDIIPDQTNGTYYLDLNNDGITDFTLKHTSSNEDCNFACSGSVINNQVKITPSEGDSVGVNSEGDCLALASGSLIDFTLVFSTKSNRILEYTPPTCVFGLSCVALPNGNWNLATDKYLGLKIKVGGDYYYGWARLDVASLATSFTIKDYAYNSIPNQSITAGQTCPPQAVISPSGTISFCAGDSAILSSVNTGTNLSYKWKLNGANISGATNKSYSAKTAGKYMVKVTDNTNGCTATSVKVRIKVPCKMQPETSMASANQLSIYPNPNSGVFNLQFQSDGESATNATIEIRNELGHMVFQKNYSLNSGVLQQQIDLGSLHVGVYNVIVRAGAQVATRKLLIQ